MKRVIYILVVFCFQIIIYTHISFAQSFDYKENAVYIFNFIKYTNWENKKQKIQIGIIGESPVENELRELFSKKKSGIYDYTVKNTGIEECKKYDVLIIAKPASGQLKKINELTDKLPILIITEKENLCRLGACISFFINEDNDNKTEYQLSLRNCKSRGLIVSDEIKYNAELTR